MSVPQFTRQVTVECMNDYCHNLVEVCNAGRAAQGVYCDDCKAEAHLLHCRVSYHRNIERSRELKRKAYWKDHKHTLELKQRSRERVRSAV